MTSGTGNAALAPSRPSVSRVRNNWARWAASRAKDGGDVDLGEDEADLALGPVQIEGAAQDDHHALRQLDARLGQRVPQRRPRGAPAFDVQGGHAAAAPRARAARASSSGSASSM